LCLYCPHLEEEGTVKRQTAYCLSPLALKATHLLSPLQAAQTPSLPLQQMDGLWLPFFCDLDLREREEVDRRKLGTHPLEAVREWV